MNKKEYESPEFELLKFRFESMMEQVRDSYGEDSGFIIDDGDPYVDPADPYV